MAQAVETAGGQLLTLAVMTNLPYSPTSATALGIGGNTAQTKAVKIMKVKACFKVILIG